jgi:hypothetical protein
MDGSWCGVSVCVALVCILKRVSCVCDFSVSVYIERLPTYQNLLRRFLDTHERTYTHSHTYSLSAYLILTPPLQDGREGHSQSLVAYT